MAEDMFETIVDPIFRKKLPTLPQARWTLCQALEKKPPIFDGMLVKALATFDTMPPNHV
jgi:hypothetical protein